ncbi:MAG: M56 family metallopeptidase [Algicola sp.]|nr:M56 family metallopeptidase [Algicola sp.]
MLIFILKFSACLAILMAFYKLVLESMSIHKFKRFYLLGAIIIAFIVPNIAFVEYVEPVMLDASLLLPIEDISTEDIDLQHAPVNQLPIILWSLYGIGAVAFLLKFAFNLNQIISRIRNNPKHKNQNFVNVLIQNLVTPYTFFNYLFLNKKKYEKHEIPKEVLLHEQTHALQKHSFDIIIIEFFQIVFWFNPLIYMLKEDIKLNHEFLADQAVLNHGIQAADYQNTLLAYTSKATHQSLANAINYSSIKKRFTVMKTRTSKPSIWLRSLLLLPLLAILLYSFTERKQVIKDASALVQKPTTEGVSEELMTEYKQLLSEYNATHRTYSNAHERMVSIYNLMSQEQRASVAPYPNIPSIDLSKVTAIRPNASQFESWKDAKTYALWLNGKPISNNRLEDMSWEDIVHFSGSFVHTNARSEKYPQPYQYSLFTQEGFLATYQESNVKTYRTLSKKYSNAIQSYLNGTLTKHSELKILKEQMDRTYAAFSSSEKEKYQIFPPAPLPAKKRAQQGATPKQLATYNALAKKYNEQPKNQRVIKLKDIKQLESIYSLMTVTQKAKAEAFPECPTPPPPPTPVKTDKGHGPNMPLSHSEKTLAKRTKEAVVQNEPYTIFLNHKGQLLANNKLADISSITKDFKSLAKSKGHKHVLFKYLDESPKDTVKKIKSLINQYGLTDVTDKYGDLPPPPPPPAPKTPEIIEVEVPVSSNFPEIKEVQPPAAPEIIEVEVPISKTQAEIVELPPPPPPPQSPLDFIVDMAKTDAKFYYENKEISSDKAISIVKNNKDLNIKAKETDTKIPLVYITKE